MAIDLGKHYKILEIMSLSKKLYDSCAPHIDRNKSLEFVPKAKHTDKYKQAVHNVYYIIHNSIFETIALDSTHPHKIDTDLYENIKIILHRSDTASINQTHKVIVDAIVFEIFTIPKHSLFTN